MAGRGVSRASRPRQRDRSQHFLRSPALAASIVADADVRRDDVVVDVGAGTGRLTAPLAERAALVYAIEVDPGLAAGLRRTFARTPNVTVVEDDALAAALPERPFRVVANLPFGGATAILQRLLGHPGLARADVVLEWDVARKRASCWPSTLLGVRLGVVYDLAVVRHLSAACFEPRPGTHAGLLRAIRRADPLVAAADQGRFESFVRTAFAAGRPVFSVVSSRAGKRAARELGVSRDDRPRDLDVHQWAALFAAVRANE